MATTRHITRMVCARWFDSQTHCSKVPEIECELCRRYKYCSVECKQADSSIHQQLCEKHQTQQNESASSRPSFEEENDEAEYLHNRPSHILFSSAPAINILSLVNEDTWALGQINVLLAASGDLGSLIKTIVEMPKDCHSHLNFVINDRDMNVVSRNLIVLLAAINSTNFVTSAETIVHFWYSAYLSEWVCEELHNTVNSNLYGLILCACSDKYDENLVINMSQQWGSVGQNRLNLTLRKSSFLKLRGCIEQEEMGRQRQKRQAVLDQYRDFVDEDIIRTKSRWRLDKWMYLARGVLLPAGIAATGFSYPNLSFFKGGCLDQGRQPIDGWRLEDVLQVKSNVPNNDLGGKLFYYLRNMIVQFITRIQNLHVDFTLTQEDAGCISFTNWDCIDASNLRENMGKAEFAHVLGTLNYGLSSRPGSSIVERVRGSAFDDSFHVQGARSGLQVEQIIQIDNYTSSSIRHHGFRIVEWKRAVDPFPESKYKDDEDQHDTFTDERSIEASEDSMQPSELGLAKFNAQSIDLSEYFPQLRIKSIVNKEVVNPSKEPTIGTAPKTSSEAKKPASTPSELDRGNPPPLLSSEIQKLSKSQRKKTAKARKQKQALELTNLTRTPESIDDVHTNETAAGVDQLGEIVAGAHVDDGIHDDGIHDDGDQAANVANSNGERLAPVAPTGHHNPTFPTFKESSHGENSTESTNSTKNNKTVNNIAASNPTLIVHSSDETTLENISSQSNNEVSHHLNVTATSSDDMATMAPRYIPPHERPRDENGTVPRKFTSQDSNMADTMIGDVNKTLQPELPPTGKGKRKKNWWGKSKKGSKGQQTMQQQTEDPSSKMPASTAKDQNEATLASKNDATTKAVDSSQVSVTTNLPTNEGKKSPTDTPAIKQQAKGSKTSSKNLESSQKNQDKANKSSKSLATTEMSGSVASKVALPVAVPKVLPKKGGNAPLAKQQPAGTSKPLLQTSESTTPKVQNKVIESSKNGVAPKPTGPVNKVPTVALPKNELSNWAAVVLGRSRMGKLETTKATTASTAAQGAKGKEETSGLGAVINPPSAVHRTIIPFDRNMILLGKGRGKAPEASQNAAVASLKVKSSSGAQNKSTSVVTDKPSGSNGAAQRSSAASHMQSQAISKPSKPNDSVSNSASENQKSLAHNNTDGANKSTLIRNIETNLSKAAAKGSSSLGFPTSISSAASMNASDAENAEYAFNTANREPSWKANGGKRRQQVHARTYAEVDEGQMPAADEKLDGAHRTNTAGTQAAAVVPSVENTTQVIPQTSIDAVEEKGSEDKAANVKTTNGGSAAVKAPTVKTTNIDFPAVKALTVNTTNGGVPAVKAPKVETTKGAAPKVKVPSKETEEAVQTRSYMIQQYDGIDAATLARGEWVDPQGQRFLQDRRTRIRDGHTIHDLTWQERNCTITWEEAMGRQAPRPVPWNRADWKEFMKPPSTW